MKVLSHCAAVSVVAAFLFSCEKGEIIHESPTLAKNVKDTVEFRGELVVVGHDFPKEFLNQSSEDFETYYSAQTQNANLRTSADGDYLTSEEMLAVLQPLARKYPDLSWEKDISEPDLERIRADFLKSLPAKRYVKSPT